MLTKAKKLSDLRKNAKSLNMTFRVNNSLNINGLPSYQLVARKTKEVLVSNMTLESAYEFYMEGGFAKTARENGVYDDD